jgi:hydrogenase nickel incorporation protein HypA/HybF
MHEYSITSSIVEIIKRIVKEKNLEMVERVDIELSPLSSLEAQSIKFYYEFLTKDDSILKNSRLKFYNIDLEIECEYCGKIYKIESFPAKCPACGEFNVCKGASDDIRIKSILADTKK